SLRPVMSPLLLSSYFTSLLFSSSSLFPYTPLFRSLLDRLERGPELVPGGRLLDAELLEDIGAHRHGVVRAGRLEQPRKQIELAILLAQGLQLVLQPPVGDLLVEVGHQVEVVADREDRPRGHVLGLLPRVGDRDDRRRIARADQQAPTLVVIAERGGGHREGDVVALL